MSTEKQVSVGEETVQWLEKNELIDYGKYGREGHYGEVGKVKINKDITEKINSIISGRLANLGTTKQ